MNNQAAQSGSQLPSYVTSATPNPKENRAPWYKNTAPTYAGIFLWFVFWQDAANDSHAGGALAHGVWVALLGLVIAALICHLLFYLVPGMFGMKTGLPLYVVGTSTFGAKGGFIMPGFLMGVLQFGWLGVNIYFSSVLLQDVARIPAQVIMVVWGVLAAFVGLKGIQYVAKVATYLPLIPLGVLVVMFLKTAGGVGQFSPQSLDSAQNEVMFTWQASTQPALSLFGVLAFLATYVVGFFATAGAAGVDFGLNSRDGKDVSLGGWVGIALATLLTAGLSVLIVAGVYGKADLQQKAKDSASAAVQKAIDQEVAKAQTANRTLEDRDKAAIAEREAPNAMLRTTSLISVVLGDNAARWLMFLLAIAAFPPACFSSFIAANSFKTTLPNVNPFISVGIGAVVSIVLALTGLAGDAVGVFKIIGASFGPICGAMAVDYLINGKQWTGPRAGFNPAGWIAWAAGFIVGLLGMNQFGGLVPAAPVLAFVVGAVVFFVCAKFGWQTPVVPLPSKAPAPAK